MRPAARGIGVPPMIFRRTDSAVRRGQDARSTGEHRQDADATTGLFGTLIALTCEAGINEHRF